MKNKECEIVKDILPLYIDNLTSDETNQFVEMHLQECKECRDTYQIMSESIENKNNDKNEDKKIINYLKKFQKSKLYSNIILSLFFLVLFIPIIIGFVNYKDSTSIVKKDDEMIGVAIFESEDDIKIDKNAHPIIMVNSYTTDDVISAEYEDGGNNPSLRFERKPIAYYGLYVSSNNLSKDDDKLLPFGNDKFYDVEAINRAGKLIEFETTMKLDVDKNSKKMLEIYNIFKRKDGSFYAFQTGILTNYTQEVSAQVGYYNFEYVEREMQYIFNINFIPK